MASERGSRRTKGEMMRRERGTGSLKNRGGVWWLRYQHSGERIEESSKLRRTCECTGKETQCRDSNHAAALKLLRQKTKTANTPSFVPPSATKTTMARLRTILEADYNELGRKTFRKIRNVWAHLGKHLPERA